jgi:hypothetical protein
MEGASAVSILQRDAAMDNQMLLDLSTRLVRDLKAWSEEATGRDVIAPEQLEILHAAAEIVDQATVAAVAERAD